MIDFVNGFIGNGSQEFVEFCVCASIFAVGVGSWIAWYTFDKD